MFNIINSLKRLTAISLLAVAFAVIASAQDRQAVFGFDFTRTEARTAGSGAGGFAKVFAPSATRLCSWRISADLTSLR